MRSLSASLIGAVFLLMFSLGLGVGQPVSAQEGQAAGQQPVADQPVAEQLRALVDTLKSDADRQKLIGQLEQLIAAQDAVRKTPEDEGFARQLTRETMTGIERLGSHARQVVKTIEQVLVKALVGIERIAKAESPAREMLPILSFVLVVVGTWAGRAVIRWLLGPLWRGFGRVEGDLSRLRSILVLTLRTVIDAAALAITWFLGYVVALYAIEPVGVIRTADGLFLNSFAVAGAVLVFARALLVPETPSLRQLPISDMAAEYAYIWLRRISGIVVYGAMLLVPLASVFGDPVLGSLLRVVIGLFVIGLSAMLIMQNRERVADQIRGGDGSDDSAVAPIRRRLAAIWHIAAMLYVLTAIYVWAFLSQDSVVFLGVATGETVILVVLSLLAITAIEKLIEKGFRLDEQTRRRLPMLEERVNSFLPHLLKAVRLIVILLAALSALDIWNFFEIDEWLVDPANDQIVESMLGVVLIILGSIGIWITASTWIEMQITEREVSGRVKTPSARTRTLLSLFRNALAVLLFAIAAMLVLSEVGINIGPLLAGAGVASLAIGFGAQSLVKDVITGVFIQLENAMNRDDVVTVGGITGVVERLTVRSVGLRDLQGVYHIVPFSAVDTVSNYMKDFAYFVADIGVAYREDTDQVSEALRAAFDQLLEDPEMKKHIFGPIDVMGLVSFGDSAVVVRARIKTVAGMQWGIGRAYNRLVKKVFDERGIEMPFPHQTVYFGEDKNGDAPVARVQLISAIGEGAVSEGKGPGTDRTEPEPEDASTVPGDTNPEVEGDPPR